MAEVLQQRGYATGAFVSNTNLTEAFGFAQGFDEYHYLGPDYLFGAQESASKLVLYQILRRVYFTVVKGKRFGDFYQDSAVVNRTVDPWLERHRDSRFFLFLHYMDVHDPFFEHPYDGYAIDRASNQEPDPSLAAEMQRLYVEELEYLRRQLRQAHRAAPGARPLGGQRGRADRRPRRGVPRARRLLARPHPLRRADPRPAPGEVAGGRAGSHPRTCEASRPATWTWRPPSSPARGRPRARRDAGPRPRRTASTAAARPTASSSPRRTTRATCSAPSAPRAGSGWRPTRTTRAASRRSSSSTSATTPASRPTSPTASPAPPRSWPATRKRTRAGPRWWGTAASAEISCEEYLGLVALGYVEAGSRPDCE